MIFAGVTYIPATLDEALARLRANLDKTATVVSFALSRSATTRLSSSDAQA
jgi:hypothetical protein